MGVNQGHSALKIFLSSSSDVKAERRIVSRIVSDLAARYQRQLIIELVDWEADFYEANDSFQAQIPNAADSDLVVCVFHRRVGTELNPEEFRRSDGSLYEGGAVYEFECAFESRRSQGTPDLFVFRKSAPVLYTEGPGRDEEIRQYELLQRFLKRWTESEEGHLTGSFNVFEDTEDFRGQFKHFFERWLSEWTAERGISLQQWDIDVDGSPFVGLAPFTKSHQRVFFGRENEMYRSAEALELAARSEGGLPSLLILGASGAGKSSFLQAALIPYLTTPGVIDSVECWLRADLRLDPQESRPLLRLAEQLFKASVVTAAHFNIDSDDKAVRSILGRALTSSVFDTPEKLADQFVQRPSHANEIVEHVVLSAAKDLSQADTGLSVDKVHLLLSVDQIETLVANDAGTEAELFLQVIESMVQCTNVWLIGAARNDFYARIQQSKPLRKLLAVGARLDLLHPDPSQIRTMVEGPARAAGLSYEVREGEKLSEVLIDAVEGAEVLPLLQVALSEMFSHLLQRNSSNIIDTVLRFEDYERLGNESDLPGLLGAIDRYAEQSWQNHTSENKETKAKILESDLRTLIRQMALPATATSSTVSRPINQELYATTRSRQSLVELLVKDRLLVATSYDGHVWLRPCHDALLRHWKRADQQIATDLNHLRWRESLRQLAVHWQSAQVKRKDHLDLPAASLAGALSLRQEFGNDLNGEPIVQGQKESLADYVDAVARRDKQKRVRRRMKYASLGVIVGAVLLFIGNLAFQGQQQLKASLRLNLESMQFAANNELENGRARTATLLSFRAILANDRQKYTKATLPNELLALLHASVHEEDVELIYRVDDPFSTFTNQKSAYLAVLKKDRKSIVTFKKGNPHPLARISINNNIIAVTLSPNSDRLAIADAFGTVYFFNATTGDLENKTTIVSLDDSSFSTNVHLSWSVTDSLAVSIGNHRAVINCDTFEVNYKIELKTSLRELKWSPDGDYLLMKIEHSRLRIVSFTKKYKPYLIRVKGVSRVGWVNSNKVYTTNEKGILTIHDVEERSTKTFDLSAHIDTYYQQKFQFVFDEERDLGIVYQNPGTVLEIDLNDQIISPIGRVQLPPHTKAENVALGDWDRVGLVLLEKYIILKTENELVSERKLMGRGFSYHTKSSEWVRDFGVTNEGDINYFQIRDNEPESKVRQSTHIVSSISAVADPIVSRSTPLKINLSDSPRYFAQNPNDITQMLTRSGNTLELISTDTERIEELKQFESEIVAVEWQPDSNGYFVALKSGRIEYYVFGQSDVEKCAIHLDGMPKYLSWKSDGKFIAVTHGHSKLSILDVDNCKLTKKIDDIGRVQPQWSPDGKYIATRGSLLSGNNELTVLETTGFTAIASFRCNEGATVSIGTFSWGIDGKKIVFGTSLGQCNGFSVAVWNPEKGVIEAGYKISGGIYKVAFNKLNSQIIIKYQTQYSGAIAIIRHSTSKEDLFARVVAQELRNCFTDTELERYSISRSEQCLNYAESSALHSD